MCDYAASSCKQANSRTVFHPMWGELGICEDCLEDFLDFIEAFEQEEIEGDEEE